MNRKALIKKFTAAIKTAFSTKTEQIENQEDFDDKYQHLFKKEYDTAQGLIDKVKDADLLADLMDIYLDQYFQNYLNFNNVRFHRSDQVFLDMVERTNKVSTDKRDLFQEWAAQIKDPKSVTPLTMRFNELNSHFETKILDFINRQREEERAAKSTLDVLRDEFLRRYHRAAKDDAELYDFDPQPNDVLKSSLDEQVTNLKTLYANCEAKYKPENTEAFNDAIDEYRKYLVTTSKKDLLQLFQIIKYLQDRIRGKRETDKYGGNVTTSADHSEIMCELYTMACLQLLVMGQTQKLFKRNLRGFTKEELTYFLGPMRDPIRKNEYLYISDLQKRLESDLKKVNALFNETKAFLNLILLTKTLLPNTSLANLQTVLEIQKTWADIFELTKKLENADVEAQKKLLADSNNVATLNKLIDLSTKEPIGEMGPELGKGGARAGSSPGKHKLFGRITIVYIDPNNRDAFYVEFEKLKPSLFHVREAYIADKLYATRIEGIANSLAGIVFITQVMFLMMGFLQPFIDLGFAGLIYEIGVFLASMKVEELVSEIDPTLGKLVGLATQILTPRKDFSPKVINPAATAEQNVLTLTVDESTTRSFEEILASHEADAKLISDFNRSTFKGQLAATRNKITDTIMKLDLSELEVGQLATVRGLTDAALTPEGIMLRVDTTGKPASGSGRGSGGMAMSRAESKLRNSKDFKMLEDYYDLLTKDELSLATKSVNETIQGLNDGMRYSEAAQKILNVLNAAKEVTGEYVADQAVLSYFKKIHTVFSIPYRSEEVPILDRVYKVETFDGKIDYLFAEIKGGKNTRLGYVTKKVYSFKNGQLRIKVLQDQLVEQGSGEWYYQKIIEIYQTGRKSLARKLFEAAEKGDVQSVIIKSGKDLEPFIKFNTDEVKKYFKSAKLPYD